MKRCLLIPKLVFFFLFFLYGYTSLQAQSRIKKTVFQGFWWDYYNNNYPNGWANYLAELAPRLKVAGFDAIWIPPIYKNASTGSVGYSPFDMYDLGDKYQKGGSTLNVASRVGTKDEVLRMIAVMHANGIEVIQDVVLNHNDGAGANNGSGGIDPETAFSMKNNSGYKNFRFTSYATPILDDSQNDYWTRNGRWSKNYPNFHPTLSHDCMTNNICDALFGPDICYLSGSFGQSSNIPTTGTTTITGITRPFYNPAQATDYMRNNGRNWIQWFKKQTGADGWRWDAIKHFEIPVQEDYIYNTKYNLPTWAAGGQNMFCVGEWIGNKSEIDAYVNNVKSGSAPNGVTNEKHTGTFDFSYRGYGPTGGLFNMVHGTGGYNMQNLPGEQQDERVMVYPDGTKVHRTVPYINSHDSYRPKLDANGNFLKGLGDNTGWNMGDELGGNGSHIDPREPRLAAAYAAAFAIDGNPCVFIEDLFDLGTTGKRFTHQPGSTVDLPIRGDIQNIIQAHQRLNYKDGDYGVPSTLTGNFSPSYQKGTSGDHIIFERIGKAIIGVTDAFNSGSDNHNDQETFISCSFPIGTVLYDYSGAHGVNSVTVTDFFGDQNNHRVLIKTAPVGHTITGAFGHGYSIWAPAPVGLTIISVQQLYDYLVTYQQPLNPQTTQEWEMADDLGDSHCQSLGQGGALPANSTNQRVAGKIFTDAGKPITYTVFPETDGRRITLSVWDLQGNKLSEAEGIANAGSGVVGTFTPSSAGWVIVKVRNSFNNQLGQKCFVKVAYTAPTSVATAASLPATQAAIWTGNKGTQNIMDCGNWEEGKFPSATTNVLIPAYSNPMPVVSTPLSVRDLKVEANASLTITNTTLLIAGNITNAGSINSTTATIEMSGTNPQVIPTNTFKLIKSLVINNLAGVTVSDSINITQSLVSNAGAFNSNGLVTLKSTSIANTAIIPEVKGSINGTVTVERFIPMGKRAFRHLSAGVNSVGSIRTNWQNNGVYTPGVGIHITGSTSGAQGFDATITGAPSMFTYTAGSANFSAIPNTANTSLSPVKAYRVFIMGDRNADLFSANNSGTGTDNIPLNAATTLSATGTLVTGTVTYTPTGTTANGIVDASVNISAVLNDFNFIANPYWSPVDFDLVSKSNIYPTYWLWDPTVGKRGAYTSYTTGTGSSGLGSITKDIQPGQAIFVQTSGANPSLGFNETNKSGSLTPTFRSDSSMLPRILIKLKATGSGTGSAKVVDATSAVFSNNFSDMVGNEDARKFTNPDENISISRDGKMLAMEGRRIKQADTIAIHTWRLYANNAYQLDIDATTMDPATTAFLHDKYLNQFHPISLTGSNFYPFNFGVDSASFYNRFQIIMSGAITLPNNFININAQPKKEGVEVEWTMENDGEILRYEVEHTSANALFKKIGIVVTALNSVGRKTYQWLHDGAGQGMHFYRIKAITKEGNAKYSKVATVELKKVDQRITIYPNPAKNKLITLRLKQMQPGAYGISIYNLVGQVVLRKDVNYTGGVQAVSIPLTALAKGVYQLKLDGINIHFTEQLIVQ